MAGEDDVTELELVGYTADMQHLVLSDPDRRGSRWYVPIDEDFLNTVEELVQDEPRPGVREDDAEWSDGLSPEPGTGPLAAVAAAASERGLAGSHDGERSSSRSTQQSRLSPRQIQALLRAGKSPKTVAKQAEADEGWVRRWLPPIESERSQVLQAVWASSVSKSRLGRSHDLVGEAVRKNLSTKGVDPDSDAVTWSATRKEGATAWTVTLRYRNRGSTQRAVWRFDPERHLLEPRNQLATDIAWTRPRQVEQAVGSRESTAAKKAAGGKSASRKTASKKTGAKKAAGKKTADKKTADKKTADKKTATKKAAGKKAADKTSATKKSATKKAPGEETATQKAAGKKAADKKTATQKAAGKKTATKKSATKKAAGKKAAGKKTATKKTATKRAPEKTSAAEKSAGKKSTGKKSAGKKSAGKKSEASRTSSAQPGPPSAAGTESSERRPRG